MLYVSLYSKETIATVNFSGGIVHLMSNKGTGSINSQGFFNVKGLSLIWYSKTV